MMRFIESHGVWELFIPGLAQGDTYKYEILTKKGVLLIKTDPCANYYEKRPQNASIIFNDEQPPGVGLLDHMVVLCLVF